jgi:hypothetical protein
VAIDVALLGGRLILQLHRHNTLGPATISLCSRFKSSEGIPIKERGVGEGTSSIVKTGQYSRSSSRSNDFAAS